MPTVRRPPGREPWLSEPIPSGRRLPRGEACTAHGFSLSGSPYPGAAARRRDPALSIPIVRPGMAEPQNSGHDGGARDVFLFLRGGGVPTRISTWQRHPSGSPLALAQVVGNAKRPPVAPMSSESLHAASLAEDPLLKPRAVITAALVAAAKPTFFCHKASPPLGLGAKVALMVAPARAHACSRQDL